MIFTQGWNYWKFVSSSMHFPKKWQCLHHLLTRPDTHFSVVQIVGRRLQDAEGDHAGSGADHEVVGVGVAGLLLSLRPDCPRQ